MMRHSDFDYRLCFDSYSADTAFMFHNYKGNTGGLGCTHLRPRRKLAPCPPAPARAPSPARPTNQPLAPQSRSGSRLFHSSLHTCSLHRLGRPRPSHPATPPGLTCTPKTDAEWAAIGCAVENALGNCVGAGCLGSAGIGVATPAAGFSSACTAWCPDDGTFQNAIVPESKRVLF